ncbi:DUF4145 domain-containing protein [Pantoea agglomerans]|uniref:DUF4145 domain-containing protein n=1 Tax=Enterobacter agglomerans TaxID=549 RepID=UPI0013C6D591|nr:DUF4145 domain-containing protein [Pantoea agglomerans]NEG82901.1 DUF4145 domain-containing protein [Pantoea agglomerans]
MQQLLESSVKKWGNYQDKGSFSREYGPLIPETISATCPNCNAIGLYILTDLLVDKTRCTLSATSECPGCSEKVGFWIFVDNVNFHGPLAKPDKKPKSIFMHPSPVMKNYQHPNFYDDIPVPLARSFSSTVDSLNSQNYPATAVGARRTLEGIFKYLVDENHRKKNLFQLIDIANKNLDILKPLSSLSHAIRSGGNLGAHFDEDNEPNEDIAKQMVELLEYLISYLYVLPKEISLLEASLAKNPG